MEGTNSRSAEQRCAVVTGANKGIGLEICHQLAVNGVLVVLTARDEKKGLQATRKLQEHGLSDVVFHQLDVTDTASIASLAKFINTKFGKLDILVNNAGVGGLFVDWNLLEAFKVRGGALSDENAPQLEGIIQQNYEMAHDCLKTNYYGTMLVTEALLPLLELSESARIVNVSSFYGQLLFIKNEKIKEQLENVERLTMEKIDEIVQWFLRDFKEGKLLENGWPLTVSAYKISKAAINAYTRLLARKFLRFRVNCVHPGLVKTDLAGNKGNLTPEEVQELQLCWLCCLTLVLLASTFLRWTYLAFDAEIVYCWMQWRREQQGGHVPYRRPKNVLKGMKVPQRRSRWYYSRAASGTAQPVPYRRSRYLTKEKLSSATWMCIPGQ